MGANGSLGGSSAGQRGFEAPTATPLSAQAEEGTTAKTESGALQKALAEAEEARKQMHQHRDMADKEVEAQRVALDTSRKEAAASRAALEEVR